MLKFLMNAMVVPLVVLSSVASGESGLPASIAELRGLTRPGVFEEMEKFFRANDYRFRIDGRCEPLWKQKVGSVFLTHSKWSTELWLPMVLARSRWHSSARANATVVAYTSRNKPRSALSECRGMLEGREKYFFTAISSRGPCCDGGQVRHPSLMREHFFTHSGESGEFLFREARFADRLMRASQYKAPASRDTSPKLRCFDSRKDVALPPPVWLARRDGSCSRRCALFKDRVNEERDILVFHAEGKRGGMEYDLRRELTKVWDAEWTSRNPSEEIGRTKRYDRRVLIRFETNFQNYSDAMRRSKFCIVSEGYSPWSPRLTEAVGYGCVPAILSPSYLPPYSSSLDWSKFSVSLDREDIYRLPEVLSRYDHRRLFKNLQKVRHVFAFCIDEGGEDGCGKMPIGDGLPLVVFEMSTKVKRRQLLGESGDVDIVREHCEDESCTFSFEQESWKCDMVNQNSCQCRKFVENRWNFVGTTHNLVGHKSYLWLT